MALSHTGKSTYLLLSAASEGFGGRCDSIGFKCATSKESASGEKLEKVGSLGGGPTGLLRPMAESGYAAAAFEGTFLLLIIASELCAQIAKVEGPDPGSRASGRGANQAGRQMIAKSSIRPATKLKKQSRVGRGTLFVSDMV
ncbi:hypothetical protein X739_32065 [Mesorhizobium sp. LNHC220B00]|nr:hypothetical protein X739_32065 [Mesorhizobium sp. LNHC220B00]